jgi:hypothetical protein
MSDARLYREMDAVIRGYDEQKVSFRALLDRLEEGADHIADDSEWQDSFRRAWDGMEQPYAYAASMGLKQIPEDRMSIVLGALSEIKQMVVAKVAHTERNDKQD